MCAVFVLMDKLRVGHTRSYNNFNMIFLHVFNMISDVSSFTGMSKVEILVLLGVVWGGYVYCSCGVYLHSSGRVSFLTLDR